MQDHFHPDDRDEVIRQVGAAWIRRTGTFEVEQRIIRTDGEVRWIRVRGRAFFEASGAAVRPSDVSAPTST
ncbi:MAG: PAS domain-containing protein [Singulisphaera sp.]